MRVIETKVYPIGELSEGAREHAHNKYCENGDYTWTSENRGTLEAFEKSFPVNVKNWEYDTCNGHVAFSMTCDSDVGDVSELSGVRLATYLQNNYGHILFRPKIYWSKRVPSSSKKRYSRIAKVRDCNLTGYCIDEDILDPIYNFIKKPDSSDFYTLMSDCFHSWVKACSSDMESYYSMESFIETAEANEWEFYEDGKMV